MSKPYKPTPDDLSLLSPELRARVEAGELIMGKPETWMFPDRPVLRDPTTKGVAKGSGKVAGSKIAAVASRESAWRRRSGYRKAMEMLITEFENSEDRDKAVTSIEELLKAAVRAVTETNNAKEAIHLIELMQGKARETSEINITGNHLHAILQERTPITEIPVRALDAKVIAERKQQVLEAD